MKTTRPSAALAALTLTASTACAAAIDLNNALGPSGGYSSQAYYQEMLGGQPMTSAQQAYADQEDQFRQLGFLSELGGNVALGQMFYHVAYGLTQPPLPSVLDLATGGSANGGSNLPSPFTTPSGLVTGASDAGNNADPKDGGYGAAGYMDEGSVFTLVSNGGVSVGFVTIAIPEPATWAMLLIGLTALGFAGYRSTRRGRGAAVRA